MARTPADLPIAPGRLPVAGHVLSLLTRRIEFMTDQRKLGDVVRVYIGPQEFLLLTSSVLVHEALVDKSRFFSRGRIHEKAQAIVGLGLASSDGDLHRRQRRIMQPAFRRPRLAHYVDTMRTEAAAMTQEWRHGQRFRVNRRFAKLSSDITARALFGQAVDEDILVQARRALPLFLRNIIRRTAIPEGLHWATAPLDRRFTKERDRFWASIDTLIERARTAAIEGDDLLSLLVAARDPETGEVMSDRQLRDEVVTILLAGTETTSATLTWLLHELGRHPDIRARAYAEIDEVVGDRDITFEDCQALSFTNQVISEALRRYTANWFVTRRAIADLTLGDLEVPAGTELVFSLAGMNRDPDIYPNPLEFRPERWVTVADRRRVFLPFGAGPQRCIGEHFSITEMTVVLATIARHWILTSANRRPVRERQYATLRPSPVVMSAERRDRQT